MDTACRRAVALTVLGLFVSCADVATTVDESIDATTEVEVSTAPPTLVETGEATPLGLEALSPNGRIQPRGRPTWYWFELGETTAYGRTSPRAALPARIGAFYHEAWDAGLAGWAGGMDAQRLAHVPSGGVGGSGFVRYVSPGGLDANHADGIGANALVQYFYPGAWEGVPTWAALSGGDPDMRGARVTVHVRGTDFVPNTSELVFWLQSTPNLAESYDAATARWSNWAMTGSSLTDALMTGAWQRVDYRLPADTTQWSYAGRYVISERETYVYAPLDQVLSHLNGDIFHMLVLFEFHAEPTGIIDFDELTIAYPNRSLLWPDNGGALRSSPASGTDPARLTDGWRHGPDRTWHAAAPVRPGDVLELVWQLAGPATLDAIQIHQDPDHPSRDLEVLVSEDGAAWQTMFAGVLPSGTPAGPDFDFVLHDRMRAARARVEDPDAPPWPEAPVRWLKVRIVSAHGEGAWGLGEVELFGRGVDLPTDDDWTEVTTDFDGLDAGKSYHYRLVAASDGVVTHGLDRTFTVPATRAPLVATGPASRIRAGAAKVEGRVCPLGEATNFWFEYGPETGTDAGDDQRTFPRYAGLERGPRTVSDVLPDLVPGTTYHARLVAENASGLSYGERVTFVAR